jgi:RHS repeat-associated protein/uncharacterized repeat protein (TIGR01451 family)
VLLASAAHGAPAFVARSVTNDIPSRPLVRLAVTAATETICHAYEEFLPATVAATNITGGGVWLPDIRAIHWGPFTNTPSVELTYRVVGLPGTYVPGGRLSADGAWAFTPVEIPVTIAAEGGFDIPAPPGTVVEPVITPPGSTSLPVTVTMTCATMGAVIRYTTDGAPPLADSTLYTGAVQVATATLIRAGAFASNAFPSTVRSAWFAQTTPLPTLATTRSVATNTPWLPVVSIVVTQTTSGVCWTYEETLPLGLTVSNITENGVFDPTNRVIKWGAFVGRAGATLSYQVAGSAGSYSIRGRWSVDGYSTEETSSYAVAVGAAPGDDGGVPIRPGTLSPPVIAPPGSTSLPVMVAMSCVTTGAVIRYTLDGLVPNEASALYTGAVNVASATWVRARSFASNAFPSDVTSAYFCQPVATPAPQLGFQVLTNTPWLPEIQIAVTQALSGVCWAYELWLPAGVGASNITENGVFNLSNSVVRWGPFVGRSNAVLTCGLSGQAGTYSLRSRWSVDGQGGEAALIAVSVTGGTNDIGIPEPPQYVARPVLNPTGSAQLPVTVSASSATVGAELRYTTNGTPPTPRSALYTTALNFTTNTVLRVCGFKAGLEPSSVASGVYAYAPSNATLQVTRTISANGTPSPSVELLVVPPAGIKCYAVTETIPERLAPYSISHTGAWDETNGVLKWGPFFATDVVRLTYLLSGMPGMHRLVGAGSADGVSSVTAGPDMIEMVAQDQLPDLAPTLLTLGNEPASERSVALTYSVTNSGKGFAAAHWTDRWYDTIYLSRDAVLDASDTLLGRFIGNGGCTLAANASYTNSGSVTLPALSEGNYYLILKTDERGLVNELNEANNVVAIPIAIPASEGSPERVLEVPAEWSATAGHLDFSPDGVRLAVAAGNRVAVWNLQSSASASNALLGSFTGHVASVSTVNFSPANDEILSGSPDGTIRIWDARTFLEARSFSVTSGEPGPAAFSADSARVLGGAARGVARIWDAVVPTNTLCTLIGHSASITAVAFSPDGTRALTGSSDKSAILWDASSGAILYRWTNHTHIVSAVAFSRDGTRALTASLDGTIGIWNPATGASVAVLRQGRPISAAVFSPDGLYIAAADRGLPGMAYIWEVSSGRLLRTFRPVNVNSSTVEGVAFSPDRAAIATSHSDGIVRLWDSGLSAIPIHTAVPLPVATDIPFTMQSHGLYYFEIDVPANRSLVVTVDAVAGGEGGAKALLSSLGGATASGLSSDVRFANRAKGQETAQAGLMKTLAISEFPPETDIEAFRVLATREHLPSVYEYDNFAQASVTNLHAEVPLSANAASKCYVLVFAPWLSAGTINAKIRATFSDFHISRITPSAAGNAGDATLKVEGLGFTPDTIPILVGSTHSITGQVSLFRSSTLMHATFNLRGATTEYYDLRVEKRGSVPATVDDLFAVTTGNGPLLSSQIIAPDAVRPGRNYTLRLRYANTGDADMVAPLFVISAAAAKNWLVQAPSQIIYMRKVGYGDDRSPGGITIIDPAIQYIDPSWPRVSVLQYLGLNTDGPPGVLPPGAKFEVPIPFDGDASVTLMNFKLEVLRADATPMDWATLEPKFRPPDMADDLWAALWANFQWQVGSTWADYLRALSDQANLMAQSGGATYDASTLVGAIFSHAAGSSYRRTLAAAVDARAPAPALPLQFSRFCTDGMEHRFTVGPLGRGWSHSFEYALTHPTNNVIAIRTPGGGSRRFTLASDGVWYGGAGEYAALSPFWDGSAVLREKDGVAWQFDASGQLSSIVEPNGNQITVTYSGGQLTTLTHSAGPVFQLQYNGQGRLIRLTDHAGQSTDYEYDGTGEHLMRVTAPGNAVTAYTYEPASVGPTAHALASITFPDNTHRYFVRNAQGWLAEESRDAGAERIQYTYDNTGVVTIRDAHNAVTTMRVGDRGQMLQMADPLGRPLTMLYDGDYNLTRLIGPAGDATELNYDLQGNTAIIVNPAGQQVTLAHTNLSRLSSLRDARDQLTGFGYSTAGNLTGITYPDTSTETFGYNPAGGLTTFHNRRGQTIQYTRNTVGQITRKAYPDGRTIDYTYDASGYLTRVVDSAQGTTEMSYDSRSFMTNITYPDGKGFTFEYNAAGRRTRRVGHDGYTLTYDYDAAGRLASLTQGTNNVLVSYTYDSSGRLTREDKGNGTFTTYTYDPAGQILAMTNHAPGGAAQSFFNYVYDSRGNRTSMTTADGVTAYQYDALNQLIGVTYPGGRNVTYAYDPAGNRTVVSDNGTNTLYTANSLNQYSQAGDAVFTYDADGNMTSRTDPTGTTTYDYDPENRLIQVSTPTNGVWQYTYDALGNRITVIHDGVTNRYLHDPIGLVDVAAEYDGTGALVAHYDHALGLVARTDEASNELFYSFDALGSTREVTGEAGTVLNSYDYDAFGAAAVASEAVQNAFCFVGRFGIQEEPWSSHYMRARYYQPTLGRFMAGDPLGFGGGDVNLYSYAASDPVSVIDPMGLAREWWRFVHLSDIVSDVSYAFGTGTGTVAGQHASSAIGGLLQEGTLSGAIGFAAGGVAGNTFMFLSGPWGVASEAFLDPKSLIDRSGRDLWDAYLHPVPYPFGQPNPPTDLVGTNSVPVFISRDPNDKIGPVGVGPDRLISAQDEMEYMIRFENHPTATAPVQELVVVDYLDPNLDWSTVEFGEIRYGDRVITVPAGQLSFSTRDLPPTNSIAITGITLGQMAVDMTATFNSQNGRLEWRLLAKDTANNQFPYDALAGFLPPNNTNTHCGEGYLTFRVKPKLGLEIGTRIENKASIVFDLNDPIETPVVTNTIGQVEPKLGASISYPASQMQFGLPFNLSLTVSNSGINLATNIVVTNAIPGGFAFVNATSTVGTVTYTNGNVVWTIGTLSNGFPATLTLTLLPIQGGYFVAPIHIDGGNGLVLDLNPFFMVQPPLIGIETLTGGLMQVFAPGVATSYVFEASQDLLGSPPGWQPLTNVPIISGDRQVISLTPTNKAFFRLRKP